MGFVRSSDTLVEMKLPGGEDAVVDVAKLRDYCLNPGHVRGRHKARVFASVLGIGQDDAEYLRWQLLRAARESEATRGENDEYGERYLIDFEILRGERRAVVRSTWITRSGEKAPRLTSCYVL